MENQNPTNKLESTSNESKREPNSEVKKITDPSGNNKSNLSAKSKTETVNQANKTPVPKKPAKPPKLEDKPFDEFIRKHLIPGLKSSIEKKGKLVEDITLTEGERPVVGGNCWMVFCQIADQRRFWLCFNTDSITSDKTILLAESDTDPSIVESFLIDEKKITLSLLISRVLQRLNGQKWIGVN